MPFEFCWCVITLLVYLIHQEFRRRIQNLCQDLLSKIRAQNVVALRRKISGERDNPGPLVFHSNVTIKGHLSVRGDSSATRVSERERFLESRTKYGGRCCIFFFTRPCPYSKVFKIVLITCLFPLRCIGGGVMSGSPGGARNRRLRGRWWSKQLTEHCPGWPTLSLSPVHQHGQVSYYASVLARVVRVYSTELHSCFLYSNFQNF